MKTFLRLLILAALVTTTSQGAWAQSMQLNSNGIVFGDDSDDSHGTVVKARTAISYSKTSFTSNRSLCFGRGLKSSIPTVELGWNTLSGISYAPYDGMSYGDFFDINNWKSTQVTINIAQASVFNGARNFGMSIALGIRANNYRFDDATTIVKQNGMIIPAEIEDRVKKSKFTTAALHIPLEVSFGNPYKFAFAVGGFADMVMNSHTKIKYKGGSKDKLHNLPVTFLQAGLTARVSMRNISVYCNYTPTPLFKSGKGPEIRQWTIGIGL